MTTTTKERPILFSAEMVKAILRDVNPKTQTRRIIKPQPDANCLNAAGWPIVIPERFAVGSILWVRESAWYDDALGGRVFFTDDSTCMCNDGTHNREPCPFPISEELMRVSRTQTKRPSIHMPRWASRITLEVVAVRAERLQDISDADAVAEGCAAGDGRPFGGIDTESPYSARSAYIELWDSIHGNAAWFANPWIWCITFKRIAP